MTILFVNTVDVEGGAARAAYRLYRGVQGLDEHAEMLVLKKSSSDPSVITPPGQLGQWLPRLNYRLDARALRRYPRRQTGITWSVNATPYPIGRFIASRSFDVLHLHWIGASFIPIPALASVHKPIIWTMHDEWAYTGGCHYTDGCERFSGECGCCPLLGSETMNDLSHETWKKKSKYWRGLPITIVAPSRWIAERVKMSSLFRSHRVVVIPNGIDTQVFKPVDRRLARTILNLPHDKRLILFAGLTQDGDRRKGMHLLQPILHQLAPEIRETTELLILGSSPSAPLPDYGMPYHHLGRLRDDISIALYYAAADVFVAPSLQDNLPNTIMEAAACGTPSVAFEVGGIPDLIDHQQTGYLARNFDTGDFARGIATVLSRVDSMGAAARHKVEVTYEISAIARRHQSLYKEVLAQQQSR